jgi:hypothetical protein
MKEAENNNEILELKFEGNGINPSMVKPSEIAMLITEFENMLLSTIKSEHPEINTDEIQLSFAGIKNESLGIYFSTDKLKDEIKEHTLASYFALTTAISNANYSALPEKAVTSLKKVQQFSKKYNCNAGFRYKGKKLTSVNNKTEITIDKQTTLKGNTTIYGELVDAGGDNPNIHIKINDDYTVIIGADKQKTKELAVRLYEFVGLKGFAKWDAATAKILEFKLSEILNYNPKSVVDTFSKLRNLFGDGWDRHNTNDEINQQLLRD